MKNRSTALDKELEKLKEAMIELDKKTITHSTEIKIFIERLSKLLTYYDTDED